MIEWYRENKKLQSYWNRYAHMIFTNGTKLEDEKAILNILTKPTGRTEVPTEITCISSLKKKTPIKQVVIPVAAAGDTNTN